MATTFTWDIIKLSCFPQYDQYSDVVFDVGWSYTGTNETGVSSSINNNTAIHFGPNTQFTPYADLTKDIVVGWIESELTPEGIGELQAEINSKINDIVTPNTISPSLPWPQTTNE